jgi:hypothetical protein
MDKADLTSLNGEAPHIPDHLRRALGEATEFQLEMSSDGFWPNQPDERIVKRDNIIRAARLVDAWRAGTCTHHQVAKLAGAAAAAQDVGHWPETLDEADDLIPRAVLARELLLLRDVLGGTLTREEAKELD